MGSVAHTILRQEQSSSVTWGQEWKRNKERTKIQSENINTKLGMSCVPSSLGGGTFSILKTENSMLLSESLCTPYSPGCQQPEEQNRQEQRRLESVPVLKFSGMPLSRMKTFICILFSFSLQAVGKWCHGELIPSWLVLSLPRLKSKIKFLKTGKVPLDCGGCGFHFWIIYQGLWADILKSNSGRKLFEVGFVLENLAGAFSSTFWPLNLIWCFLCIFISQMTSFSFLEEWIEMVGSLVFL